MSERTEEKQEHLKVKKTKSEREREARSANTSSRAHDRRKLESERDRLAKLVDMNTRYKHKQSTCFSSIHGREGSPPHIQQ